MSWRHGVTRTMRVAGVSLAVFLAGASLARAADWIELFNGKDLTGWKPKGPAEKSKWTVGTAKLKADDPRFLEVTPGGHELINALAKGEHSLDFYTEAKFGDAILEIEVMVPKGSNSGIYVMGEYEIQVLDSFGRPKVGPGDMGGIYGRTAPLVNASKAPGEWQKYVIEYRAPKFDAEGKKIVNTRVVKITLNDQVIHDNVEVKGSTGGPLVGKEAPTGALMLQGNHGAVAFRNIRIKPLEAAK